MGQQLLYNFGGTRQGAIFGHLLSSFQVIQVRRRLRLALMGVFLILNTNYAFGHINVMRRRTGVASAASANF